MRKRLTALVCLLAVPGLTLLPTQAHAVPTRNIRVFARAYGRSAATSPVPVELPIPFALARDANHRIFTADAYGQLDLTGAASPIQALLQTAHFLIRNPTQGYAKPIAEADTKVVFEEADAPMGARMAAVHLERERAAIAAQIGDVALSAWFQRVVPVIIDYDEGCNAGWTGSLLSFNVGDSRCVPAAEVADLLYHEYGHAFLQFWRANEHGPSVVDLRFNEGFADSMALMMTGDPHFGAGFWKGRQLSWLRDLSERKVFPEDFRGTYTGAEIFSSAMFEIRQAFIAQLGEQMGAAAALRTLIASARIYPRDAGSKGLELAAIAVLNALGQDPEVSTIPGLDCTARQILSEHGLLPVTGGCGPARVAAPESTSCGRELIVNLIRDRAIPIPDAPTAIAMGPWVNLPFAVRLGADEKVAQAILEFKTDHPFPDDLLLGFQDSSGALVEFFKGEEELEIRRRIRLPQADLLSLRPGIASGALVVRDLARSLTGAIVAARLVLTIRGASCP